MTTRALVVLAEGFEDVEAVTVVDVLRRAEVDVVVAGLKPGLARGARGVQVQPEALLADVAEASFDALVLPGGGKGAENLAASPAVREILLRMHREGKLIAAICAAPGVVLAPAGVLEGKSVTGYPGTEGKFPKTASVKKEAVVVDGNLVTGRAMGASLDFSLAVVEKLLGREAAEKVRRAAAG